MLLSVGVQKINACWLSYIKINITIKHHLSLARTEEECGNQESKSLIPEMACSCMYLYCLHPAWELTPDFSASGMPNCCNPGSLQGFVVRMAGKALSTHHKDILPLSDWSNHCVQSLIPCSPHNLSDGGEEKKTERKKEEERKPSMWLECRPVAHQPCAWKSEFGQPQKLLSTSDWRRTTRVQNWKHAVVPPENDKYAGIGKKMLRFFSSFDSSTSYIFQNCSPGQNDFKRPASQSRSCDMSSATYQSDGSFVYGRDGEVGNLDLPDLHGVEPVVRLHSGVHAVVGAWLGQHVIFEELGVLL